MERGLPNYTQFFIKNLKVWGFFHLSLYAAYWSIITWYFLIFYFSCTKATTRFYLGIRPPTSHTL